MLTQPTASELIADLGRIHQQFASHFIAGQAAAIAALYAKEGQILPAHSTAICGRAAIQAFWQGCIDMGIASLLRRTCELDYLREADNAAGILNETGEYRFFDRTGQTVDIGKYVIIWKRHAGARRIHRDIWTSNLRVM